MENATKLVERIKFFFSFLCLLSCQVAVSVLYNTTQSTRITVGDDDGGEVEEKL